VDWQGRNLRHKIDWGEWGFGQIRFDIVDQGRGYDAAYGGTMKRILLLGCALIASSVVGAQAATLTAWQGSVTIVKLTEATAGACAPVGFSPGDLAHSIYRAHLAATDPPSALSVVATRGANIIFQSGTDTKLNGAGTFNATYIGGRATAPKSLKPYTGSFNLHVTPASPTAATNQVTVTGTIGNFFDVTGCTVTIEGSYFKRLN
jgi:hypothetical protein